MIGDPAQAAASAVIASFLERLAAYIHPHFPVHATLLRGEMVGRRLTTDRWHRIAAALASLHAVPGIFLEQEQHDARNAALDAIVVAQRMAAASFGTRDPVWTRDMAIWRADEISGRIARQTTTRT
jgi:hypothetical protein